MPSHFRSESPNLLDTLVERFGKEVRVSLQKFPERGMIVAAISGNTFQCGEGVLDRPGEIGKFSGKIGIRFPKFAGGGVPTSVLQSRSCTFGLAQSVDSVVSECIPEVRRADFPFQICQPLPKTNLTIRYVNCLNQVVRTGRDHQLFPSKLAVEPGALVDENGHQQRVGDGGTLSYSVARSTCFLERVVMFPLKIRHIEADALSNRDKFIFLRREKPKLFLHGDSLCGQGKSHSVPHVLASLYNEAAVKTWPRLPHRPSQPRLFSNTEVQSQ